MILGAAKRIARWLSITLFFVFATAVLAEGILRLTPYRHMVPFDSQLPMNYHVYYPDGSHDIARNVATSTHRFSDSSYEVWANNIGCFDAPIYAGEPYVLLVGDSFTWGFAPYDDKWGTIIDKYTGVRVAKCGVIGYGTTDELTKARRVIEEIGAPLMILVGYTGDDPFNDALSRTAPQERTRFDRTDHYLRNRSVLYVLGKQEMLRALRTYQAAEVVPVRLWPDAHEEALSAFRALAVETDAELLFVLIPYKHVLQTGQSGVFDGIVEPFRERNLPYVDLATLMAPYVSKGQPLYWSTDHHWNSEGNRLAGYLVAKYLLEQRLIPFSDVNTKLSVLEGELEREFGE